LITLDILPAVLAKQKKDRKKNNIRAGK